MLKKADKETFDKYIDYAYSLALQPEKTSYPVYYDGIKTKEDFVDRAGKGLSRENEEILLYMEGEKVLGWIHYYYLEEDNYLAASSLSIETHTGKALEEFLAYVSEKHPGYNIWLGFPEENEEALSYLADHGFERGEESYNDVMILSDHESKTISPDIVRVTEENYELFEKIHSQWDGIIYWDCKHIRECLEEWIIFLSVWNGRAEGAIYCMKGKIGEIFGVDFTDQIFSSRVFCSLVEAVLCECKREHSDFIVMFGEEEEQRDMLSMGFSCVGKYVLMMKK